MRVWGVFLLISLSIHLIIWTTLLNSSHYILPEAQKSVEISIVDDATKTPKMRQIVRQTETPKDLLKDEKPKNAKYLSEHDQVVKKETVSPFKGLTKNRVPTALTPRVSSLGENKQRNEKTDPNKGDSPRNDRLSEMGRRMFAESSTTGEYLPDIQNGPITALNTERFLYYSFFQRIEEAIRPKWEDNIRVAVNYISPGQQKQFLGTDWVTGIEVILSEKGEYIRTIIRRPSGIESLDRAAIEAFREAAMFPNPPREMLQDDNRIHLKYVLVVEPPSRAVARRSSQSQ
jgi:TonB family protein